MPRPLRPQVAGAYYHIGSRGVRKLPIVHTDDDCQIFLATLAEVVTSCEWDLLAYCLMANHYHLVVRTPRPNIAAGMHRLNLAYALGFNRRHGFAGHLFEARYWSGMITTDGYLLEATRYVVLNPVRAGAVRAHPHEYAWSSYRPTVGISDPPAYLALDWLQMFDSEPERAKALYRSFVYAGLEPGDTRETATKR